MSYIQIEIGGKLRGLKFNQGAIISMATILDRIPEEDKISFGAYALIYAGLKGNCIVKGEEIDFTFEQVSDWVDALSPDVINKVSETFNETQKFRNDLPKTDEKPAKKKALKSIGKTV